MNTYFLLYSYVFVNCADTEALLLNTETGVCKVVDNANFIELFKKISLPTEHYMIGIPDKLENDPAFVNLLTELEADFFGESISTTEENKPIQFSPQVKINNNTPLAGDYLSSLDFSDEDFVTKSILDDIGSNIVENVLELSIYYSTLRQRDIRYPEGTCNQYMFPVISHKAEKIRSLDRVFELTYPRLLKVNFVVGDIDGRDMEYIKDCVRRYGLKGKAYLYITVEIYEKFASEVYTSFENVYVWHIGSSSVNGRLAANQKNYFLVENEEEMSGLENDPGMDEIYPLYNGSNMDFMKSYLSYLKEDLLNNGGMSEREIFMNTYINTNLYGELSVYPDGEVFSRKNSASLGNIQTDSLKKMLLKEYCGCRNWFLTRSRMPVCKDCIYNWVCPPVTSNELEMENWTFCKDA